MKQKTEDFKKAEEDSIMRWSSHSQTKWKAAHAFYSEAESRLLKNLNETI